MSLSIEDDSVRSYLTILQGVINRTAANSASCKAWCVTIVSAMVVLTVDKNKPQALLIALLPVSLFLLLDVYYLSLEQDFRDLYNAFIVKVKTAGNTAETDVYCLKPANSGFTYRTKALLSKILSFAILPFYGSLTAALLIGRFLLLP